MIDTTLKHQPDEILVSDCNVAESKSAQNLDENPESAPNLILETPFVGVFKRQPQRRDQCANLAELFADQHNWEELDDREIPDEDIIVAENAATLSRPFDY